MSWDTIESDPGIFSTLLEDMGVRGVEVNEGIDLDALPPSCLGLLFLFQYSGSSKSPVKSLYEGMCPKGARVDFKDVQRIETPHTGERNIRLAKLKHTL